MGRNRHRRGPERIPANVQANVAADDGAFSAHAARRRVRVPGQGLDGAEPAIGGLPGAVASTGEREANTRVGQ